MNGIYEKLELPRPEVSLSKEEGEFLYNFIEKHDINSSLEVGLAYGCSSSYITSARQDTHVIIDPYQKELWNDVGLKNLSVLELLKFVKFENDLSHNVLPKLLKNGDKFDFIFIDALHLFDHTMVEFYFADLLLNHNGFIR